MVFYMLYFTAELENLTDLQPRGGCDDPSFTYNFKVKCENCGEVSQKATWVTLSESVPLPLVGGPRISFKSANYVEGTEQFRWGFEPVEFSFGDGWKAESTSGTWYDIDLSEGEFVEYDEKGECPVGVTNLQSLFKVVKKQERGGGKTVYA
uniref:DUF866 domain-containing protein n=1 Tax=Ananas comosus var. bracteatus TaxID=296719 RepID=A0A6V7P0B5_ANACO|nr:unnamed protein product [Ananas comosus var. bracteatus]